MHTEINDDDMGDIWRAHKKARQEKRAENRETSAAYLKNNGITFQEKNLGAHLIVSHNGHVVDFWPGTGLWHFRSGKKGRGVINLMNTLKR